MSHFALTSFEIPTSPFDMFGGHRFGVHPDHHMHGNHSLCPYMHARSRPSFRGDLESIRSDKDKFQVNLDVQQFKPQEIRVTLGDDNMLSIEGKHEERQDEHGYISRQFTRRYKVPSGVDMTRLESRLSTDGVLTITAPKLGPSGDKQEFRNIPIQQTGKPSNSAKSEEQIEQQNGVAK